MHSFILVFNPLAQSPNELSSMTKVFLIKSISTIYEDFIHNTPTRRVLVLQFREETEADGTRNGIALNLIYSITAAVPIARISGKGRADKAKGIHDDLSSRAYFYYSVPKYGLWDGTNTIKIRVTNSEAELRRSDLFIPYGPESTHGTL